MKSSKKLQAMLNNLDIYERDVEQYQRMLMRNSSDSLKERLNSTLVAKSLLEQAIIKFIPTIEQEIRLIQLEKEYALFNRAFNNSVYECQEKEDRENQISKLKKEIDEKIN